MVGNVDVVWQLGTTGAVGRAKLLVEAGVTLKLESEGKDTEAEGRPKLGRFVDEAPGSGCTVMVNGRA